MPTCLLIPLNIVSISYSSKCRPTRWIHRSLSSSIEQFCILIVSTCLLISLHIFPISDPPMCQPARWIQAPQFIYWTCPHPHSAKVPTCRPSYLFPCIVSFFRTHPSADLPDEYRSPSSSTVHFCILQVPTCQMNAGPSSSIVHFLILQVPTCRSANYFYLCGP